MRRMVGLSLLMLCFALLTPSCASLNIFKRGDSASACGPRIGQPAPEIDGETCDGQRLKLSEQKGKVAVVVFWFSKCMPCRALIPHERDLVRRYHDKPFVLLGVNNDENPDDARRIMAEQQMNWPIWKPGDGEHKIYRQWGVKYFPAIFVIDAEGILRYSYVSELNLDNIVDSLVIEAEKKQAALEARSRLSEPKELPR
jgi:peroxiredoxin